jgi:hypothetical protein
MSSCLRHLRHRALKETTVRHLLRVSVVRVAGQVLVRVEAVLRAKLVATQDNVVPVARKLADRAMVAPEQADPHRRILLPPASAVLDRVAPIVRVGRKQADSPVARKVRVAPPQIRLASLTMSLSSMPTAME